MRRRPASAALLGALVLLAACSGDDGGAAPSSATARTTAPPAVTASISTVAAPTTAAASTSAAAAPTSTSAAPTTTAVPATTTGGAAGSVPACADQPNAPVCTGPTVPLPPDADAIVARYRAFAAKHLEVQANADAPDWDGFLAFVAPDRRAEAKAELQQRIARGEVLNTSLGVTLDPRVSRLRYPDGFIELLDCRRDGSYWTDKATGAPLPGEVAEVRTRPFQVQLVRVDGVWYLNGYEYAKGTC